MAQFVFTEKHSAGLIARLVLGGVMLPHGLQKTLGMFGGQGFMPSLENFLLQGIPYIVGALVIAGESIGAILLIIGFAGRFMAAWIAAIMIGAVLKVHLAFGFFMNWKGVNAGEGIEFHLLAIGLACIVMISGSGVFSVDHWLTRRYWS
jgi:putative oxidoreductase